MENVVPFIRACWNSNIDTQSFIDQVKGPNCNLSLPELFLYLIHQCGQDFFPPNILFGYLTQFVRELPLLSLTSVDENDQNQILGLLRVLLNIGDHLFNSLEIGDRNTSICAVKTMKIILLFPDEEMQISVIKTLAKSRIFSILIASANSFSPQKLNEIREILLSNDIFSRITPITVSEKLLKCAILNKHIDHPQMYFFYDILLSQTSLLANLMIIEQLTYDTPHEFIISILTGYLSAYHSQPSLQLGYIITNSIVRTIRPDLNIDPLSFNRETFLGLFDDFEQTYKFNSFQWHLESKDTVHQFIEKPPTIEAAHAVDIALTHPCLIPSLHSYVKERLSQNQFDIIPNLLEYIDQFAHLLVIQSQFSTFLPFLSDLTENVFDKTDFEHLWFFLLSLVRIPYSYNDREISNEILKGVDLCSDEMKSFLSALLGKDLAPKSRDSANTPFQKSLSFYASLCSNGVTDEQIKWVQQNIYLWPAVFLWGIKTKSKAVIQFLKLPLPRYKLADAMCYHMMIGINSPRTPWIAILDKPDFNMLMKYPPPSLEEVRIQITKSLASITCPEPDLLPTVILWRAWSTLFGFRELVKLSILTMMWDDIIPENSLFRRQWQSTALFLVTTVNSDSEKLLEILDVVLEILRNESEISSHDGLALFCLLIVMSMKVDFARGFEKIIEMLYLIMNDPTHNTPKKTSFALSLVKTSLYIKRMRKLIPFEMYKILLKKHDWQACIDFFICVEQEPNN